MILKKYFANTHSRSKKAISNIIGSFLIKGVSIIVNLAIVPLTIKYLNPTKYGVWLTLSSMMTWINFFDIGVGNGLRNKLSEAISKGDMIKAKAYVSTAYYSISIVCFFLLLLFLFFNYFIDWNTLLNIPADTNENLNFIASILFFMFSIQFVLQLINSVLFSNQMPAKVSLFSMISNILILVFVYLLVQFVASSLFYISFVFSIIPVMVLAAVNFYYFSNTFKIYSPEFKYFDIKVLSDVLNIGLKFFIIQISVLIFYQTTNFLISRYFSPAFVTPYNIAFRYFGIITMVFSIFVAPYWSAITEAYIKQDILWIKNVIKNLFFIWVGLVILSILMLTFSQYAYYFWVGDKVHVDFKLSFFVMLYTLLTCFGNIFIVVLNGVGKIKIQMIVNIIGVLIFMPLSYYLAVILDMGIIGIIISTIICSLYGVVFAPFEVQQFFMKYRK